MREILAKIINAAHLVIVVVAASGWFIFDGQSLRVYVATMLLILIQWLIYKNQCVLTAWEDHLLGRERSETPSTESTFIGRLIMKLTGKTPTHQTVNLISYGIHISCVTAAILRILSEQSS